MALKFPSVFTVMTSIESPMCQSLPQNHVNFFYDLESNQGHRNGRIKLPNIVPSPPETREHGQILLIQIINKLRLMCHNTYRYNEMALKIVILLAQAFDSIFENALPSALIIGTCMVARS